MADHLMNAKGPQDKLQNALRVIKFNACQLPDFKEQKGKAWIKCGEKDDYPEYLIKLYQRSSKHSAIINGKVDYIIGNGWEMTPEGKSASKIQKFINQPNPDESLNELAAKAALDLEIFNGFAIEVVLSKGGNKQLRHIPFHRLRTNSEMNTFYYTKNWQSFKPERNEDWEELPAYDPLKSRSKSIFYYQTYTPKVSDFPVYPLPEYIGAIPYIEIDYEIANFHLNNIKNSFWGSFLINMYNGIPTEEQQDVIEKKIRKKFSGTDNAGRFILNFSDGKERGSDLQALTPNELDKLFDQLNKTVQQEIFICHKVTSPMLFGVKTEGQLGGRSEIAEAFELFKNTYIVNRQAQLEEVFNYLYAGSRFSRLFRLIVKPPVVVELPINEATVAEVLDKNEIRQIIARRYNIDLSF